MRPRFDRVSIFKMLALNWDRKKIRKEGEVSEATFWRIKAEYNRLSEERKEEVMVLALEERKARARFEDYEFVQEWTIRMQSEKIKSWKRRFNNCRRIWLILQKKNPEKWTSDDIKLRAIPELRKRGGIFQYLLAVRSLRPDLKDQLPTKREKAKPKFEWKYVYQRIMQEKKLETFLKVGGFKRELVKRLQVTLGCREGTKGEGALLGLEWKRVNWEKKTIDVYEPKNGEGFYWIDCPLDLFDDRTFEMLRQYWIDQGCPKEGKIFRDVRYCHVKDDGNGKEYLTDIYREAAQVIGEDYGRGSITPHFARKLHVCLLIDADVPLEMVAGDGHLGIMGVGWENLDTLRKYYLAFRKSKIIEARMKARKVMFD